MARYLSSLLLALIAFCSVAEAGTRTIRGRVLDTDGQGVKGAAVATAWTATEKGMQPLAGVRTDAEGRFALGVDYRGAPVVVLALDRGRRHGALVTVSYDELEQDQSVSLTPMVQVDGDLTVENGKYYPDSSTCWLTTRSPRTHLVRVTPTKGKFSIRVPPGDYDFTIQAAQKKPRQMRLSLSGTKRVVALGTIDLEEYIGRVNQSMVAPPIVYEEGHGDLDRILRTQHFPSRWTLCYFWAHR